MTSVAVVSSAMARISFLKDQVGLEGLREETPEILASLEGIKKLLEAAYAGKTELAAGADFTDLEKNAVRLSYNIVIAFAQVLLYRKDHTGGSCIERNMGATGKIHVLIDQLKSVNDCLDKLMIRGNEEKDFTGIPIQWNATGSEEENDDAKKNAFGQLREKLLDHQRSVPPNHQPLVVYVVGERGMGKTTLVRKLFHDPHVRSRFYAFAWVSIGRKFKMKEVLRVILQQLRPELDTRKMDKVSELMDHIFAAPKDRSYLIVVDDIGDAKDCECLRFALPVIPNSAIIFTTSSQEFYKVEEHHKISGLTRTETLDLLNKLEASFQLPGSEKVREAIYEISGGSPLLATILGKSLEAEAADATKHERLVHELYTYNHYRYKGRPIVLGESYRRLAPELKPLLLYMGLFPPGQDIDADMLYMLLAAENLIESLEQSSTTFLGKLARLKLIQVQEDIIVPMRSGFYKSCRLHHLVWEFCKFKGLDEEFLEIFDFKEDSKQVVGPYSRRLAIYMRNYRGGSCKIAQRLPTLRKIMSLLIFDAFESAEEKSGWPLEIEDLTEFYNLRVLNFYEVDFKLRKLPKGLGKQLLLRFLSFRGCFLEELPSSLSSLTQLETLDLLVRDGCCVTIPADNIFTNMKRMVHLYLPRQYQRKAETKLTLHQSEMLETLINFDTEIFEVAYLAQLKKLKVLSTITNGQNPKDMDAVIDLLNEKREEMRHSSMEIRSFDCYNKGSISALNNLLCSRSVHSVLIEGQIRKLPGEENHGSGGRVAEMVLHDSKLVDDPMGYLGRFQNLRSIVLADDAFIGTEILISCSPLFPKLRSLKLRKLQNLENLTIEDGAVPELSSLHVESCGGYLGLTITIPEQLYHRLKNEIGGDAYSVVPSPIIFNTTP